MYFRIFFFFERKQWQELGAMGGEAVLKWYIKGKCYVFRWKDFSNHLTVWYSIWGEVFKKHMWTSLPAQVWPLKRALCFSVFWAVDSQASVKNETEKAAVLFVQFPPVVMSCKTIQVDLVLLLFTALPIL